MFTVSDVAEKLKVSQSTIYNAIECGDLPHHRFGKGRGTIRVSEDQLRRFLEGTKVEEPSTRVRLRDITYRGSSPS